jgi:periplasmic divalent cation tolerance protein
MLNVVYMTAGSREEAKSIAAALVESKLAACVNIFDGIHSVYVWDGKIQEDDEWVLIAKTTADLVPKLTERVKALHSYACPCIVSLPVSGGNPEFLDWIAETVNPPEADKG